MTINPRDYDLNELREMARERGDDPRGPPSSDSGEESSPDVGNQGGGPGGGLGPIGGESEATMRDSFQSGLYRELLPLEAGANNLEKPYLTHIPETYAAEFVVFEWLEFLRGHFGYQGTNEALQYYESVGWITEDVESDLNDYLLGIETQSGATHDIDIDDHKLSLVYIARLVSMT
jgi:flagellar protein FlaE